MILSRLQGEHRFFVALPGLRSCRRDLIVKVLRYCNLV